MCTSVSMRLNGSCLPDGCTLISINVGSCNLQDATLPAAGHTSERRAGLDERRRSHHDDGNDRRRLTGDAAQQADRASAEAAPPPQVLLDTAPFVS